MLLLRTRKEKSASDDEDSAAKPRDDDVSATSRLYEMQEDDGDEAEKMPSVADRIKQMESKKIRFSAMRDKAAKRRMARSMESLTTIAKQQKQQQQLDDDDDDDDRRTLDRLASFAAISDTSISSNRRLLQRRQLAAGRRLSLPDTVRDIRKADSLQSVANFRAHVLSRTSISPNVGQQFRWIHGQWQRPFPSPRDRVAPPSAMPRRRRQSLPSKLVKDGDGGLTSRHRAILLRSSIQRVPASRPTGTAVRFDDATKRAPHSPAQQRKGVPGPAYQQPIRTHQRVDATYPDIGPAHQLVGPAYKTPVIAQQVENPAYHSGDSAYQPPGLAHQRPVVACRPQLPYQGSPENIGTNMSTRNQERTFSVQAGQGEKAWSPEVEHAPAWSRTMAAPTSRNEATLSFTKKRQARGPTTSDSQFQLPQSRLSEDRSVGGVSARPTSSPQKSPRPTEPAGAGFVGGASPSLPRPPTSNQPIQRPTVPMGTGSAVRREAFRQNKRAVMEKADSVDEDEFDKLVAINYKQLVDNPAPPTGTATLLSPVTLDPQRSPKLSPRIARRASPAEQAIPPSAPPSFSDAPPSRQQVQQTADSRQEPKADEESEDELSKLSLADKLKLFSGKKSTGKSVDSAVKGRRQLSRFQTQPVTLEELEQAHDWSRDPTRRSYGTAQTQRPSGQQMKYRDY